MVIRRYKSGDCVAVSRLFYDTVHSVNASDYSPEQLYAWANDADKLKFRHNDLSKQYTLVAEIRRQIVGFGSIDKSGYLDLLFVHRNFQRHGVATALCNRLEKDFQTIKTYSSITAKPFFESRGYTVVKAQNVVRSGVELANYKMIKNKI